MSDYVFLLYLYYVFVMSYVFRNKRPETETSSFLPFDPTSSDNDIRFEDVRLYCIKNQTSAFFDADKKQLMRDLKNLQM